MSNNIKDITIHRRGCPTYKRNAPHRSLNIAIILCGYLIIKGAQLLDGVGKEKGKYHY